MNIDLSKKKILTIEAIRGLAAIYVLLAHIVQLYNLNSFFPGFEFVIKTIFGFAHQAVILFFIVSGFSIHFNYSSKNLITKKEIGVYFRKRMVRLYPIFLISLILSLMVLYITQTPSDYLRNILSFIFLTDTSKGAIVHPIPTNFPIWSLSYEVFYYLLYPLLFFGIRKYSLDKMVIASIVISLIAAAYEFIFSPNHLTNLLQLYWTWVIGALLADLKLKDRKILSGSFLKGLIIFSMAFMFTLENVSLIRDWAWALFFTLIFISYFSESHKTTLLQKAGNFLIGIFAVTSCFCLTYQENILFHPVLLRYILIFIALGSVFFLFFPFEKIQALIRLLIKPFVKAGSYSYALYIIHWPLIILFKYIFLKNQVITFPAFALIVVGNVVMIFILSRFLELYLQPIFSDFFNYGLYFKKTTKSTL